MWQNTEKIHHWNFLLTSVGDSPLELSFDPVEMCTLCHAVDFKNHRSQNHRMYFPERNLKDNLVPTLLPWVWTRFTRPRSSEFHPTST